MKATKAQRLWCKKKVNQWRPKLFLGEWFIDLTYPIEDKEIQRGGRPAAECWADPIYKHATITVYLCFWNAPADRREHMLVHELAHLQTQAVWNVMIGMMNGRIYSPEACAEEIEKLTQRIANIAFQQEWD